MSTPVANRGSAGRRTAPAGTGPLFDQAADLPPAAQRGPAGGRLRRRPRPPRRGRKRCWPATPGWGRPRGPASWKARSCAARPNRPWARPRRSPSASCRLPSRIGRYRLFRLLGEGGMGTVYEAEQDNPRRTVALKVDPPGPRLPRAPQAFGQEAQILGRLHHPGIAQIYEAGLADDGRPFFAMELIRGLPLDEYARRRALTLRTHAGAAGAGVRRRAARPRPGRHPPRPQARQHPGGRDRPAQGARLRRGPRHRRRPARPRPA